jgi:thioredoxin:protein disulfide reductase
MNMKLPVGKFPVPAERAELFLPRWRGSRAPKIAASLLALAFGAFSFGARAQDSAFTRAASVLQPQAYVSLQPVPRGSAFQIAVVAKITPGFHVNAHEPSEEYLIPTKVTAELPAGVSVVETDYPRGVMRAFQFSKTPLRVYETSFTIKMKLRANGTAGIGHVKIPVTIAYQACNQDSCLPPTKIPLTAELEIAAADTPAHPVNTDVFAATSTAKPPAKH